MNRLVTNRAGRHWRLFSVAVLSVIVLTVGGVARSADAPPAAPPPPTVSVAKPVFKKITEWDEYTGRFVAQQRVDIRARISGYLDSVHFAEGQTIEQGQLLFVIDPRPLQAEVARARAEVDRISTQLKVAQLEFERGQRLESSRAMSRETMEERKAARDAAKAQVEAAQATLHAAELQLGFTEVRAPLSGRLSDIRVDVGNLISGGTADSTVLTTLVTLDPIELEFEASEAEFLYYSRLSQAGTRPSSRDIANPVEARLLDEAGWAHKGKMTFVDNEVDINSGTMRGRATFVNTDHLLLPGMFARLRLFGAGEHDAVMIPDAAIVADQARKLVLVVGADNIIEARPITPGPMINGLRVIREGLKPEERIVVNGVQRAHPGKPVTPEETTVEASAEP